MERGGQARRERRADARRTRHPVGEGGARSRREGSRAARRAARRGFLWGRVSGELGFGVVDEVLQTFKTPEPEPGQRLLLPAKGTM